MPAAPREMGVKTVPIEYTATGKQRSLRIFDIAEVDIEAMEGQGGALVTIETPPFTAVPGQPAVVATSKKLSIHDHGISLDISGKNGFYSAFTYQS